MDRIISTNTVAVGSGDTYPSTGTPGQMTSGNPNATPPVPATVMPAYFFNMVVEEIRNAIIAAGLTPAGATWTQLTQALFIFGSSQAIVLGTGSGTWDPPANWTRCGVLALGGGGAGGNGNGGAGGGGQAGGCVIGFLTFTAGTPFDYVVGAGGGSAGDSGGSTSIGGLTAEGGASGVTGSDSDPYAAGGSSGVGGYGFTSDPLWESGAGGQTIIGAGGQKIYGNGSISGGGDNTNAFGSGGSGGVLDGSGGPGVSGVIIIFGTAA